MPFLCDGVFWKKQSEALSFTVSISSHHKICWPVVMWTENVISVANRDSVEWSVDDNVCFLLQGDVRQTVQY